MSLRPASAPANASARVPTRLEQVLEASKQFRLQQLHDRGDETGPKAAKEKKPASGAPYAPQMLKEFDEDKMPKPTYNGVYVETNLNPNALTSTEAERTWLRTKYGNSWSAVDKSMKLQMIKQARHALSISFAPKIIAAREAAEEALKVILRAVPLSLHF